MYNEKRKAEYLENLDGKHSDDYIICITSLFNKTEKFEKMFGKDLCDFSREEISTMYSMFGYSSAMIYNTFNCNAKKYVTWCDEHMLIKDFINHFNEFCFSDFDRYIDTRLQGKKFLTKEELYDLVDTLPNVRDKFLFMSLFEFGKSKNYIEITNMRLSDIDVNTRKAKLCTGREVSLTRKYVEIAIEADQELTYYFLISGIERKLQESEFIFKIVQGFSRDVIETNAIKFISRVFKKNLETFGGYRKISPQSIALSGQFDMIGEKAAALGLDKREYIFTHFDELAQQYVMTPNNPKAFYEKYEAYL